jgi:hypothetical protein
MRAITATATVIAVGLLTVGGLAMAASGTAESSAPATTKGRVAGPLPARLADGKPNWTGFWVPVGGLLDVYRGLNGLDGVPGGLSVNTPHADPSAPEMKSPYREELAKLLDKARSGQSLPDKVALCFPPGMPQMMIMVYGMEVLQTPKIIALTSEWQAASRRVWMDMKEHPPAEELEDTYTGHSIGHWEADTLVVDTVGIRTDVPYFSQVPLAHGPHARITERFHQTAPDVLVDDMTLVDPDVFVKPWVKSYAYHYRPDLRLEEYVCLDNNRNVDDQGRAKFQGESPRK